MAAVSSLPASGKSRGGKLSICIELNTADEHQAWRLAQAIGNHISVLHDWNPYSVTLSDIKIEVVKDW